MNVEVIDANLGMNLRIYETFPKKLFSSFTVIGGLIVAMAMALAGFTSIPLLWTRKPKNFPKDTLNATWGDSFLT